MFPRLARRWLSLFVCLCLSPVAHAADHAAVNETIWPSQNDIAQTAGNGKKLLENQWAKPTTAISPNNYTLTGLTVPGTSGSLSIDVALGTASLAGRHVTIPAATSVTAAASSTNYVFLKLTRDGPGLANGVSFEVNTTGTAPADSTPIATLTAGASTITATTDLRILPTTITVLTSSSSWIVPAGITQIYVEVLGASGGGGGGGEQPQSGVGNPGSSGGAGGTTTFDALSVTGGAGGKGGAGGITGVTATTGADHGVGSGGAINLTGSGRPGGRAGNSTTASASPGELGGDGGYAASHMTVTPGTDITYAIGAAGTAGAGGTGGGGPDGGAGRAGLAGVIVVHYY